MHINRHSRIPAKPNSCNCLWEAWTLLFNERDFKSTLIDNNLAADIETFNSTSKYLDALSNINNVHIEQVSGDM